MILENCQIDKLTLLYFMNEIMYFESAKVIREYEFVVLHDQKI